MSEGAASFPPPPPPQLRDGSRLCFSFVGAQEGVTLQWEGLGSRQALSGEGAREGAKVLASAAQCPGWDFLTSP